MRLRSIILFGQSILCSYFAIMGGLSKSPVMLTSALFIMVVTLPWTFLYIIAKGDGED